MENVIVFWILGGGEPWASVLIRDLFCLATWDLQHDNEHGTAG